MTILNLTQHVATPDQIACGVVEPVDKKAVQQALTFSSLEEVCLMCERAEELADMAVSSGMFSAMIGGAPFFMPVLERALVNAGINVLYAFSERVSVETREGDTITKIMVFKHVGFVRGTTISDIDMNDYISGRY